MENEDSSKIDGVCSGYPIDWQAVKRDYLSSKYSVKELAEKYGCYPETVKKYIRRGYWPCCRSAYKLDGTSGGVDLPVDKAEDIREEYRVLWDSVKKRLIGGMQSSDLKQRLNELKAAKVAGDVLNTIIKGEKEAWGLEGDGSRKAPDEERIRIEELTRTMESITVPPGADETLD
jgi:hypothetical protein